ncbi:MAG: hypothetical protein N3G21_10595 [Candidatus Hydrogenedentes bacterium]|nr:hypothetical protein [Candidatus Hydrogenedentota bacterium]
MGVCNSKVNGNGMALSTIGKISNKSVVLNEGWNRDEIVKTIHTKQKS